MAWFNKVDVNDPAEVPSISPDTEPSMLERLRAQSWFDWALRAVAAVIIILVVLVGARTIHHHLDKSNSPSTVVTRPNFSAPNSPSASTSSDSTGSTSGSSANNSGKTSGTSSTKGTKSPTSPAPTQVPNTGPGDDLAIFMASALTAASLHYVLQLRRQS